MTSRDDTPLGSPIWIDLLSSDAERSKTFYGSLFGWSAEGGGEEFGGYVNFSKDGHLVAGLAPNDGASGAPDAWTVYLAVADANATAESASSHGANVFLPAMEVGDLGSMAVLSDPGGAVIGMWQPGVHRGFGLWAETDSATWFELFTRDFGTTVDFYRDVFGCDPHNVGDSPEFRYTTLNEGETQVAGIMDAGAFLPEGVPAHWSVYFGTDDADASVAKAVELGATVVAAAEDTPYGRLASLADPLGVGFKLIQPPAS